MFWRRLSGWVLFLMAGLSWAPPAQAQYFGRTTPSGAMGPTPLQMVTNPYLNPGINPFLNQNGMSQNPLSPNNAALYYWMAQQQAGGLGTGQLSGTRPTTGGGLFGGKPTRPVAKMSYATAVPGAGASSYFQGGWNRSNSASKYYNRREGHYMNSRGNLNR